MTNTKHTPTQDINKQLLNASKLMYEVLTELISQKAIAKIGKEDRFKIESALKRAKSEA